MYRIANHQCIFYYLNKDFVFQKVIQILNLILLGYIATNEIQLKVLNLHKNCLSSTNTTSQALCMSFSCFFTKTEHIYRAVWGASELWPRKVLPEAIVAGQRLPSERQEPWAELANSTGLLLLIGQTHRLSTLSVAPSLCVNLPLLP